MCAAPGGKAAHILELQPGLKELVAVDNDAKRMERVGETMSRLQLNANLIVGDGSQPADWWDGQPFERILLDAPCSATGVIRRHPDIKILRRSEDIDGLAAQQKAILDAVWPLLATGGVLVYATCSILKQENEAQMMAFLAAHPDAEDYPIVADWGRPCAVGRQILSGELGMDGFYYARLRKR
jgi:16S rRNA (cytosine967-C5)-methyltransferase